MSETLRGEEMELKFASGKADCAKSISGANSRAPLQVVTRSGRVVKPPIRLSL